MAFALLLLIVVSSSVALSPAHSAPTEQSVVFQQGQSPTAGYVGAVDTYISRLGDESTNYSDSDLLRLHSVDQQAALLRFDVSSIGAQDAVGQATLSLYVASGATTNTLPLSIYAVLRPWRAEDTTWYNATVSALWMLPGCNAPGVDRANALSSAGSITAAGAWVDFDVTGLVRAWVSDPAGNWGLVIKAGNAGEAEYAVYSAEGAEPATRPRLAVLYTPAGVSTATATQTPAYGPPREVVFQQGLNPGPEYAGGADTFISDYGDPTANYGQDAALRLRSNDHRAALLSFDVSSLPASAAVYSATLSLYSQSRTNINPLPVTVHRMLRPWADSEATWYLAGAERRWAFPGANGLGTDRQDQPEASVLLDDVATWLDVDVTNAVRAWVRQPSSNGGLIFKAGTGTQVEYALASGHYLPSPYLRPKLRVVYALPTNVTPLPTLTGTPVATPTATPSLGGRPITVTFQRGELPDPTYQQAEDTFISNRGDQTANYAGESVLTVGANDSRAALLRFDLTRIPPYATVRQASLSLFSDQASIGYPLQIAVFDMLHRWRAGEATWISATVGTRWDVAGANGPGADHELNPAAAQTVSSLGDWYSFDVTLLARDWVVNPDENLGLILKGLSGQQVEYGFLSSEHIIGLGGSFRPKLTVVYTVPDGPTPTPTNTRTASPQPTRWRLVLPIVMAQLVPASGGTATATQAVTPIGTATRTPSATPTATATPQVAVFHQGLSPYDGYNGAPDTYISDFGPGDTSANFSDSTTLSIRSQGRRSALIAFDVSSLPRTARVANATLSLYVDSWTNSNSMTLDAYKLLRPWDVTQATWLNSASGLPWAAAGANAVGVDRAAAPAGSRTLAPAYAWYALDLTDLAAEWVADPTRNFGVILRGESSVQVEYHLRSGDYFSAPAYRPKLVISYYP